MQQFGRFLHFAPERTFSEVFKERATRYVTADIEPGRADLVLNIEALELEDGSFDTILANHVLEHVDDSKALLEIRRVLSPNGLAILTVPVVQGWNETYEDHSIEAPSDRHLHYGQGDHVRYYGRDVEDRIKVAGFRVEKLVAGGRACADHALERGDTIYLAHPV